MASAKPHLSHEEATIASLKRDPEFAVGYLNAVLADGERGEQRINLLGWLQGAMVHMTYTERGDDLHIISLRKAEKHEIKFFIAQIPR